MIPAPAFDRGAAGADGSGLSGRLARFAQALGKTAQPRTEGEIARIRMLFLRAGLRAESTLLVFFGAKLILAILFPLCLLSAGLLLSAAVSLPELAALAVFALMGFYAPNLRLNARIARRREKMARGFPDALDLLVVCTEAGLGLDAALRRVGAEMRFSNRVVSDEFRTLDLELRAGKSRHDALRNLALRVDIEDVNSLAALLIQTDKFGTSVGQALRVQADALRTKQTQKAEEMGARLPVKLLFPTIFCIFPSVLLVILGPALIQAFRELANSP